MGKKVLIVEDEVIHAIALSEEISKWGCPVVDTVESGEEAIRVAEEKRPDVVLMDICIHGRINGIEAAREIGSRLGIQVIFMTGYDDEETEKAAESVRPLAVLVKPLDVARLKELLLEG